VSASVLIDSSARRASSPPSIRTPYRFFTSTQI
jgi:hypothetical protein